MIKKLLLPICCLVVIKLTGQTALDSMINTENAFSTYAVEQSMRNAFLLYSDSLAVGFTNGDITNIKTTWAEKPSQKSKLSWSPQFAVMSASKDMGVTSGIWEFRASENDTVSGRGLFSTIWRKNDKSEWKFIADYGYNFTLSNYQPKQNNYIQLNALPQKESINPEVAFTTAYKQKGNEAYKNVITDFTHFNTKQYWPLQGSIQILLNIDIIPGTLTFTEAGSGLSNAGDIYYSYGYVNNNNKKDNYMRVWYLTAKGWRLLMQTINF